MATHSSIFLPGESYGQRSLAGYSPLGHKKSDTTKATQHVQTITGSSWSLKVFEFVNPLLKSYTDILK